MAWHAIVYPAPKPRGFNPLEYLARYFDTIEINSSSYGAPRATAATTPRTPVVALWRGLWLMRIFLLAIFLSAVLMAQRPLPNPGQHPEIVPQEVLDGVDALRSDPAHYHLEFENEQVRVLRLTLKGSESVPIHDAQDALMVCLRECHLRLTYPDSSFQDIHVEVGKTLWVFGNTRTEENLSVEPLEMLVIESKVKRALKQRSDSDREH